MAIDMFKANPKPMPKGEGEALEEEDIIADEEAGNGLDVKKQNPYGPPFPGLYDYFRGKR